MSKVTIGGEDYPIKMNFTALKRSLPLFGFKYITDLNKIGEEIDAGRFPVDALEPFIRNLIIGGMMDAKDEREYPTIEAIEAEMNTNMGFFSEAITAASDKVPEKKPKPRTRKASR